MALNFGGGQIFSPEGLYNDIGKLNERWAQDGSEIINILGDNVSNETVYTVTAGKKLFVKCIFFDSAIAGDVSADLRDGGAGGTGKIDFHVLQDDTYMATFEVPLVFETSIYINSTGDVDLTITGWEENT